MHSARCRAEPRLGGHREFPKFPPQSPSESTCGRGRSSFQDRHGRLGSGSMMYAVSCKLTIPLQDTASTFAKLRLSAIYLSWLYGTSARTVGSSSAGTAGPAKARSTPPHAPEAARVIRRLTQKTRRLDINDTTADHRVSGMDSLDEQVATLTTISSHRHLAILRWVREQGAGSSCKMTTLSFRHGKSSPVMTPELSPSDKAHT
jgi:hypothetical protein